MRKRILTEDDYSKLTTKQALEEYLFEQSNLIDRVQREMGEMAKNIAKMPSINSYSKLESEVRKKANKTDLPDLTPYATNQEVEDLYNGLKTEIEELKKLIK